MFYYMLFLLFFGMMSVYMVNSYISISLSDIWLYNLELGMTQVNLLFLTLVVIVSLLILGYSVYYMGTELKMEYYMAMMFIFMLSMLCLLVAGNWVVLVMGWEGLGMSSFFLINFSGSWESYGNSFTTLMTMRIGDFFMFMFFSDFLYNMYYSIPQLTYVNSAAFLLFAATKSALFPFSGWLPKAMSAPTPTSALVHSSTLVTAGLVLIMNYSDLLCSFAAMSFMLVVGTITMVVGSLLALVEGSVKKVVAFSTLSQMGLAMMVYGTGNLYLGFLGLIAHGFAKSLLFMQVGYLMHLNFGRQSHKKWGSVWVEGVLQVQLLLTLFSLCGLSYLSGMVLKEAIFDSLLSVSWMALSLAVVTTSIYLTFVYSVLIYKSLYTSDLFMVYYCQSSVVMLLLSVEVLAVIMFGAYTASNVVTVSLHFSYMEVVVPLVVILLMISLYNGMMIINMYNGGVYHLLNSSSNYPHYVWVKKILLLWVNLLEKFFFYLGGVVSSGVYLGSAQLKFTVVGSFHNLLLFLIALLAMT